MIARISGILEQVTPSAALVATGAGLWYEVLLPASDLGRLDSRLGQEIILFTIHYLEGDPSHGAQTPRLVGFLTASDREFFKVFTTVKGIGNRKALRALAKPVSEIAAAIQARDTKMLVELPEIGKRTADQIVAELHDKVEPFAGPAGLSKDDQTPLSAAASEAVVVLVQLGERRPDAVALVDRVLAVAPDLATPETIIQHVYRLKAGGA